MSEAICFLIGCVIGSFLGMLLMGLCVANGNNSAEKENQEQYNQNNKQNNQEEIQ